MKSEAIARLLPEVFQRTYRPVTPLAALLDVMEDMQDPVERTLDDLDATFDPRRTTDAFVPFLAQWVDLDPILAAQGAPSAPPIPTLPSGHGRLRELVAAAAELARLRGTALGLQTFLEKATGYAGFVIEEGAGGSNGASHPFHFTVRAPAESQQFEPLIRTVITMEKPAHATCELTFAPAEEGEIDD